MASSGAAPSTRRSTRQQSRDPDQAAPPSPAKGRGRPRTARSASAATDPKAHPAPSGPPLDVIPEVANLSAQPAQFAGSGGVIDPSLTGVAQASMNVMRPNAQGSVISEELPLHIDDLYGRSKALLHQLVFKRDDADYLDELALALAATGLPQSQRLQLFRDNFESSRQAFTQETYINTSGVLLASTNRTDASLIDQGNWRPDAVLEKANLATLALRLAHASMRMSHRDMLLFLDAAFPLPFLNDYYTGKGTKTGKKAMKNIPAGFSHLSGPTFDLLLSIRTQLAIARLQALRDGELNGDREEMLGAAFYSDGELRSCAVDWTSREGTFTADQQTLLRDRSEHLRAAFHPDGVVAFDDLDAAFPWRDFRVQVFQWIRWRDVEIEGQIVEQGGVLEISDEWSRQMTMPSDQPKRGGKKSSKGSSAAKSFLSSISTTQRQRAPVPSNSNGEGDIYEPPASPPTASPFLGKRARGVAVGRVATQAENDAMRMPGDFNAQVPVAPMAKRPRLSERDAEHEASQDAGFQTDERSAEAADNLRRSLNMQDNSVAEIGDIGSAYRPASASNAHVLPQEPDDASQFLTPADQYRNAQALRKQKMVSTMTYKLPQQRKAWTLEEINALLDAIARLGPHYSMIKKDDDRDGRVLEDRDPEALRHKARNMKYDYLVAGTELPPNFDRVLLDKKFQVKLAEHGIDYRQDQARRPPLVRVQPAE